VTDDGTLSGGASGSQTVTPVPGRLEVDSSVKVNLLSSYGKKGRTGMVSPGIGGRLTAMAQGSEGRYVVGGGQCMLPLHSFGE